MLSEYKHPTLRLPEPCTKTLRLMWPKINVQPDGCWNWTGCIKEDGYPSAINVAGADKFGPYYRPQRLMFHWFKHEIPEGLTVDHLCGNRICVNPDHMEVATAAANTSKAVKRQYCKRGHILADPNLYYDKKGKRKCRGCMRWHSEQASKKRQSRK